MKSSPLVPAEPAAAGLGTPYSTIYDDVYHSAQGAVSQARHVFLAGNDLPARWADTDNFVVCETGFGLGLNFLVTWQAWHESKAKGRLHFVSVEKHPFRRHDLAEFLAPFSELAPLAGELLRQWPPLVPGFHRLHFHDDRVTLTLLFGDAQSLLPQLAARADAVFLDGFSPAKNPEIWTPALLATITRLCKRHATLATWSAMGELRRTLEQAGWRMQRRPGHGAKREMLAGRLEQAAIGHEAILQRKAMVIGAGIAGTSISERLAERGWQIDIFDRHAGPAREASGNPSGILLPHLAKDDALAARLSRACYLYALRRFAGLPAVQWSPCGVLQVARDAAHEELQRATVQRLALPADFAAFLERDAAAALIGRQLAHGGWWFPGGGWINPASACTALLAAGGDRIKAHFGTEVASLRRTADGWQALDDAQNVLADAPHVILANAHAANRLLAQALPLTSMRGQISYVPERLLQDTGPALRHAVCRAGYVTPSHDGMVCVGASFDRGDPDLQLRSADHAGNLQRLDDMLPGAARDIDATRLDGRAALRSAAPDRLPLVGTLPDTEVPGQQRATLEGMPRLAGLHALLGLSARGLVWAPLVAELLACQLEGDPLPVERELARALDPARFHLRALRRGGAGL